MAEVLLFHHALGRTPGVVAFSDELRRAGHSATEISEALSGTSTPLNRTGVAEVLAAPRYREAARRAGQSIAEVADPVRVCHEAMQPAG